jgi:hypothetical protein
MISWTGCEVRYTLQPYALPTTVTQSIASVINEPWTSRGPSGFNVLPNDVHPLPKMAQEQRSSKSRKSGTRSIERSYSAKKKYMPLKPIKRGIKVWAMACVNTGCLIYFDV